MEENLKFDKETHFVGRNGCGRCSGLNFFALANYMVVVQPLTSRDIPANCRIEIPPQDIDQVCAALQQCKLTALGKA